jgi:hypothetical protein
MSHQHLARISYKTIELHWGLHTDLGEPVPRKREEEVKLP